MSKQLEEQFMQDLTIQLISYGQAQGVQVHAMNLPGKIWLNWRDVETDISGTAQIDGDVSSGSHGNAAECAVSFIDYIVQACDSQAY